jgi:hypothetical protein
MLLKSQTSPHLDGRIEDQKTYAKVLSALPSPETKMRRLPYMFQLRVGQKSLALGPRTPLRGIMVCLRVR